jgi:phosphatidylethanolamine/phosphatidyl-N-methylethanolamine N-methyltransferase
MAQQSQHRSMSSSAAAMQGAYAKWAGVYDAVYGLLLKPGQKAAIRAGLASGRRILEVGVGTGLALDYYPPDAEVTGIDLSPEMLERAQSRVQSRGLSQVKALLAMDAMALDFADASFDAVLAQYVLTLVPDAEAALDEFARVVRVGGRIVVVSHIGAADGLIAEIEEKLAPAVRKIGWSSDFKLSRILDWCRRSGRARLVSVDDMPPAGFFKVITLERV